MSLCVIIINGPPAVRIRSRCSSPPVDMYKAWHVVPCVRTSKLVCVCVYVLNTAVHMFQRKKNAGCLKLLVVRKTQALTYLWFACSCFYRKRGEMSHTCYLAQQEGLLDHSPRVAAAIDMACVCLMRMRSCFYIYSLFCS